MSTLCLSTCFKEVWCCRTTFFLQEGGANVPMLSECRPNIHLPSFSKLCKKQLMCNAFIWCYRQLFVTLVTNNIDRRWDQKENVERNMQNNIWLVVFFLCGRRNGFFSVSVNKSKQNYVFIAWSRRVWFVILALIFYMRKWMITRIIDVWHYNFFFKKC